MTKCKDCKHFKRCKWLLSRTGNEKECDWKPSRFIDIIEQRKADIKQRL